MTATSPLSGTASSPQHLPQTMQLNPTKVGMLAFLLSEVAFFSTLITTYIVFLRETVNSSTPKPADVFHMPLVFASTGCLLFSSVTIHLADTSFRRGNRAGFLGWWGMTMLLGATFIACTAKEWLDLINKDGVTISRNMFGSTYFTLVGFHAAHVTIGLIALSIVWILGLQRKLNEKSAAGLEVVSWYWHFVDVVWIAVFTLVYLVSADHRQYIVWFVVIVAVLCFFLIRSELRMKQRSISEVR